LRGQVSINRLQTYVIAFVVIGVAGSVGLSIMSGVQGSMTLYEDVTGEQDSPANPLPTNYTLDKSTESTFVEIQSGSVQVSFYDSSADTYTTLTEDTDYTVYYEQGEVTAKNSTALSDYDAASDHLETNYTAEMEDTDARQGAGYAIDGVNELLGWLPIIGLVVAAAVVLGLVGMFAGSSGTRRRA